MATITQTTGQLPEIEFIYMGPPRPAFLFDKRREDFRLTDDVSLSREDILYSSPILKEGEERIDGEILAERTQGLSNLAGQHHAELLFQNPIIIPREWQQGPSQDGFTPQKLVHIFLGTDWRGQFECRTFPCLKHSGRSWDLFFLFLGDTFTAQFRLVQLQKKSLIQAWAESQVMIWGF